jgi:hypothetical protein
MSAGRWTMPAWMEPYRDILTANIVCHTSVEEMMHRLATEPHLARTNAYVYDDAVSTAARVGLLTRLHSAGLLVKPSEG